MEGHNNNALEFKELTPEETAIVATLTDDPRWKHVIRVGPKGYALTKDFEKHAADIYNMELKKGDIFVSGFKRSGEVGGWREYFDEELSREAEQWIEDNLRDSDLRFPSIPLAQ